MRICAPIIGLLCLTSLFPLFAQEEKPKEEKSATKEELQQVKEALDGLSESFTEYRNYVDALRKIKVTGYLQPQWRFTDVTDARFPIGGFSGGAFGATFKNQFQVRRGRVKVMYDNVLTQFVIQIDAIQTGFTTKDAYLAVTEPWMQTFGFQAGIFDRPFGYEVSYSSSSRESPERSRMYQTLFPGERELGAKVFFAPQLGALSFLRADLGVFNGAGPTANEFDSYKDFIGHVAAQFPIDQIGAELDLGVSGYFGKVRNATKFLFTAGNIASNGKGFVVDSSAANLDGGAARTYIGVDAQFYLDVPALGGAILRAEYIFGKQPGTNSTSSSPSAQPAGATYHREFAGYYVYYIQNIGPSEQVVLKYDVYDPNTKVEGTDFTPRNISGASALTATDIKYSTLGLGFIHHLDDNVKLVLYYELVRNEKLTGITTGSLLPYAGDVRDNVLTFRIQYKF